MEQQKNILDHIHSKQGDVPDASFYQNLAQKIVVEHTSFNAKKVTFPTMVLRWVAVAAVAIPIGMFFFFKSKSDGNTQTLAVLDALPQEVIVDYVHAEQIEEFAIKTEKVFHEGNKDTVFLAELAAIDAATIELYLEEEYMDIEVDEIEF